MKIAIVCDILGGENNGTAVATMNLVRHLEANGHEVRLICADEDRLLDKNTIIMPRIHFVGYLKKYVDRVGVRLPKCDKFMMDKALDGVDYIHCMMPFALSRYAADYAKAHNIPISAGFHLQAENISSCLGLQHLPFVQKIIYKAIDKNLFSKVDSIHFPTDFMRRTFEGSVNRKTVGRVISNGVNSYIRKMDCEKPEEFKDEIVILTVGRYAAEKSQDTLIKAIAKSRYRDKIRLIAAGKGAKETKYKKLARKLPLEPVFNVYPREEIVKLINYCDIYVHPAVIELEGIACLEALKCGKLTLVSDSKKSATKDFVEADCVFKKRDPASLAELIDFWIEHPNEKAERERQLLEANIPTMEECMLDMDKLIEDTYNRTIS